MSCDSLVRFGWNDRWTALFAPHRDAGRQPGRVVRVDRDRALVATAAGDGAARARDLPAVGDWVALEGEPVVAVLPRAKVAQKAYRRMTKGQPEAGKSSATNSTSASRGSASPS